MTDPFVLSGHTALSFSGGSTSGYMLWRVLQANGRENIYDNLKIMFANTGKEEEATLRFVRDCAVHWDVPVDWVEYRDNEDGFAMVDFATASRAGEPFEALIRSNCDLCFLKPVGQRLSLIRDRPERVIWWARMEREGVANATGQGAVFRADAPSYAQLATFAQDQGELFDVEQEPITCFCGD